MYYNSIYNNKLYSLIDYLLKIYEYKLQIIALYHLK